MKTNLWIILLLFVSISSGCVRWPSEFISETPSLPSSDADRLFNRAMQLYNSADEAEKIEQAIEAFKHVLKADPEHYDALTFISNLYILLGDAYSIKKPEKIDHFRSALIYSELAMYTNPEFKASVDKGAPVWEAAGFLTKRELDAMFFWTTALFYYYKEGLNGLGQVIEYRWVKRAKQVLDIMTGLDPEWGGGGLYFTWGVYYLSIPESVGGDRKLSEEYFKKAIDTGPDWLLNRWGRAKYYHVKMQNPLDFKEDLQWVLKQDIKSSKGPYPWKAYFIKDAQNMLDNMDDYF